MPLTLSSERTKKVTRGKLTLLCGLIECFVEQRQRSNTERVRISDIKFSILKLDIHLWLDRVTNLNLTCLNLVRKRIRIETMN